MPDTNSICTKPVKWREITVSRTERSEALYVVMRHLDAMIEAIPDHRLLGWCLHMSKPGTVCGAVIYEENEPDTNNETIAKASN
jgi:hypothetical protein